MVPKKSLGKGKDKPSGAANPVVKEGWRASKCSNFHLLGLVEEKLLQPREVVQWRKALGGAPPHEGPNKTVMFQSYILRGLEIPTSDFFRDLLHHWGIQAHHLTPNSILHIYVFVHFWKPILGSNRISISSNTFSI